MRKLLGRDRLPSRRRQERHMHLAHSLDTQPTVHDTLAVRICLREVREFIAGDDPPVDADPAFRERLRDQLWGIVSVPHAKLTLVD